eukprot:6653072-Prorocentrum_lima.AAC.1
MTSSLVGSEMCIRDRYSAESYHAALGGAPGAAPMQEGAMYICGINLASVSYTHLTLPTICSV